MADPEPLIGSLRQRHRNSFGKAYPLVGYDELQALLDHVADLEHELADVTYSRELQFKAANLARERANRNALVAKDAVALALEVYGWAVHEPNTKRVKARIEALLRKIREVT